MRYITGWSAIIRIDRMSLGTWALHQVLLTSMPCSIVQGSGFGPPSYIVVASDLHPKHECNVIDKFADDTYLLVGSNHLSTATEEFEHISAWAMENNLRLNPNKTRELKGPLSKILGGARGLNNRR